MTNHPGVWSRLRAKAAAFVRSPASMAALWLEDWFYRRDQTRRFYKDYRKRLRASLVRRGEAKLRHHHSLCLSPAEGRPQGAIEPDSADLWFLYRNIRRLRPETILEFGSGWSTLVMAEALRDNHRRQGGRPGRLHTIEADPFWADQTARLIPPELRDYVEIRRSDLTLVERHGVKTVRYANVPQVVPDLVYLDGPAPFEGTNTVINVLEMEDRLKPGFFLIIDFRRRCTDFHRRHLRRRYKFSYHWLQYNFSFRLIR